ncbi:hypothetical protein FHY12_003890 [Xanthomonas arboricola]|nr:hypothetical protein [Xanthomonas euroxanthea]
MRPRQPLLCAHAAGLAKPRLVACTTAQWPSMLMQALSMDESRLLPKGARSVATHGRVRCACIAREGRSDLYSRGYCDRGFTRVFALFPGARARKAGPPTGRMWCPIALAMMTNGLHADEAGSEKRWGKAADVGCAASSAIWNSVAGRACVHAPAPACRCLSGRRCRRAAISNMHRCRSPEHCDVRGLRRRSGCTRHRSRGARWPGCPRSRSTPEKSPSATRTGSAAQRVDARANRRQRAAGTTSADANA